MQELPTVVDGGQDPVAEEAQLVEEEFDLSDILGEELDAEVGTKEDRLRQLAEQVYTTDLLSQSQPTIDDCFASILLTCSCKP